MEEDPPQGLTGRPRAEGIPSGQAILWRLYRKIEVLRGQEKGPDESGSGKIQRVERKLIAAM